ncbi:uncharacterized protein LOC119436181 isoform X2 [Dermacentor silvarum]|uniref:uncharacterized protein LOC119436181 isoform X2 n=1 Tax=Dermacentor silvarum TaxID=543639 RepID=UPI001896EDF2|nr:uncharacterized protein LOC119436181 isoform X2 [Dermacentor silvarum]
MFWLRQHIFPLAESFQDRERSPGAESFRSALSDGAESFYSALSDHRSSVYYDAESSDLNSSDSDSRYADVDEEPCPEEMPAVVTEFEEAVTKESTLDEAYESFSYGKLFEDVYGTVVHRPPLLKCQQKRQDNKNEKQPPRRWRPLPRIPVKSDLPQENLVTWASSEVPAHHELLPTESSCYMNQEQDGQEMNDDELGNEMQEESIPSSFFYLEQAAEEFAEFIVEEAKHDACRSLAKTSTLGNKKIMAKLGLDNLSNDGACKTHVLDHSVIHASDTTLHPVTSEDRDILDAFNRQFEPCFDSEEEPDSQAFENASEEEADCMEYADLDEKGLLNRNALLGTFKRFPQPALDSNHEHSFSDSSRTGRSSRHRPTSVLPTTSSASELTDKYWRRYSSDTADTAAAQYKRLDSVEKNFLSSDPDISKYSHLNLSNGHADSTMISVPDTTANVSSYVEPVEEEPDSLKDSNAHVQARCLPVTYSNRLLAEGPSELYPSCELFHENRSSVFSSAQENDSALLNEQPKPSHHSPRHSNATPPSLLEEQPKPPPRSPRHSNVPPPSLLEEPPKPPPRSPRHSNITPPSQYLQISPEAADVHQGSPLKGNAQVDHQVDPESGLCVKNRLEVPARRRRAPLGLQASEGILLDGNAPQKETSMCAVGHQCSEDSDTFTKQGGKEELVGQDRPQTFGEEFQHGEMCYESDEDSSLSSCEDSGTDEETSTKEIRKQSTFHGSKHDEEPPTKEILRLPFSLSELSRHLFEDDSPLDVVSFNVVENCDFLNDSCSGSAPYMMKLGPNDDLSAFLVDPGTNEHPEVHDSDIDSVFEDTTFEPFYDCNLDSVHSGCLPSTENHAKCDEDVENRQSLGSQQDLTKSVFDVPTRPLRKRAYPSLKNKESPVSSMDVQLQDNIEPELTCSDTASSEEMASMVTANIPCVSQGTDASHIQHMGESQNSMYMRVVTSQEHSVLEADVHGQADTFEAEASGNERNAAAAAAATTLSGSVASSPLPTSCSYQAVPQAGVECDKLPRLENTSGDSFFGRASVNADCSYGSTFQKCVKEESDKMVMQEVKLIEEAPLELLKDAVFEEYTDFAEDKQKHGGSSRVLSQTFNNQTEPKAPGECQPSLDKGNSTKRRHVHVLGRTQDAVTELCKVKRGIQGHHNSCYLDATLFAMFSCTYIFDDILNREHQPNDIDGYDRIQKVLRDDIVNTLRSDLYVPSENVMRLRELLDSLGGVSGLTTEEKDPEEFLNSLFSALKVQPFLKLSSQQETHLYQLFVAKNELLEIPTVQQLFHQSIHESKLKLKEIPKALIIQMPRCGKQFKLYDHIVPSLKLDITDALENSPRFCYVCGRQATQECWNCFRPDVGLECTSYCDSCNKTVHQHQDRDGHKQTALSNDRFGEDAQPRRQVMTLFAVVCIETSHYVCFVKCPVEDGKNTHTWCFFDSMADREGGEDGHNIPKVDKYLEADTWFGQKGLEKLRDMARPDKTKLLPGMTRRLLCDAYLCMYQDEFVKKYK